MATPNQMLLDFLAGPSLTKLVTSMDIKPGTPRMLPAQFYDFHPQEVVGINVIWDAIQGARNPSQLVDYDAPARQLQTQPRTRRQAAAVGHKDKLTLDMSLLTFLQSTSPVVRANAIQVVQQKFRDFKQYSLNIQTDLVHSAFFNNAIYADANGVILTSSSGAKLNVGFGGLYSGVNALGVGSAIPNAAGAPTVPDFNTTSNDIPTAFRQIEEGYTKTSNSQIGNIVYGINIPKYFYNNTAMQTYMSRAQGINQQFLGTNEVPKNLFNPNYNWIPGDKMYTVSASGTVSSWCDPDTMYLFPEISEDWYQNFVCSLPVPNTYGMVTLGDPTVENSQYQLVRGFSSYCYDQPDPLAKNCVMQHYSLPTIKNPYVVFQIKVH